MWKFHKVTKEEKIKLLSYNKVTLGYALQCPDNVQILWPHYTSERWKSVIYTISQLGFFHAAEKAKEFWAKIKTVLCKMHLELHKHSPGVKEVEGGWEKSPEG